MDIRRSAKTCRCRGSILVVALVALLVASMLGLGLIEMILIHHRQTRVLDDQRQGFWIAEAGVQRAIRKLAADSDYTGEVWELPAEVLATEEPVEVAIAVSEDPETTEARRIQVAARFARKSTQPIVARRELVLELGPPATDEVAEDEETTDGPRAAAE